MLSFPNAKINLGLNIIEKRPDGFHNIESVFYPIGWSDVLEIIRSDAFAFSSSGLEIPGDPENNLIVKAYHLLKQENLVSSPVKIHLHKVIAMGAGMGGGSADGAFALKMLNDLFELNLSTEALEAYAIQLGSDCPFFIQNKPMLCSGRGNEFEAIDLDLKGKYLLAVNPGIHISTAEAYGGVSPEKPEIGIKETISRPVTEWKGILKNDFENKLLIKYPAIDKLKELLYKEGALYASMTGSGSTVYGIFEQETEVKVPEGYMSWEGVL